MGIGADWKRPAAKTVGAEPAGSGREGTKSGRNECRFCGIVAGRTTAHVVSSDEVSLAFLDHRPLFPGHMLLVPRLHIATLADLPDELISPFFSSVRLLARAAEEGMAAEGSFVAINNRVSQSVHHLHVHIVPRRRHDGLKGFFWPRHPYNSEAEMVQVADMLRAAVERLKTEKGG